MVFAAVEGRSLLYRTLMPRKPTSPQVPSWGPAPGGLNVMEEQRGIRTFYWKLKAMSSVWLGRDGEAPP